MRRETPRRWLVKGSLLETGEDVEEVFNAESESLARAMARLRGMAVREVAEVAEPAAEKPNESIFRALGSLDRATGNESFGVLKSREQRDREEAQRQRGYAAWVRECGQEPVRLMGMPSMVWQIAWGVMLGNLMTMVAVVVLAASCTGYVASEVGESLEEGRRRRALEEERREREEREQPDDADTRNNGRLTR